MSVGCHLFSHGGDNDGLYRAGESVAIYRSAHRWLTLQQFLSLVVRQWMLITALTTTNLCTILMSKSSSKISWCLLE